MMLARVREVEVHREAERFSVIGGDECVYGPPPHRRVVDSSGRCHGDSLAGGRGTRLLHIVWKDGPATPKGVCLLGRSPEAILCRQPPIMTETGLLGDRR